MKNVIITANVPCVNVNDADYNKIYGAIARDNSRYILEYENWSTYPTEHGWIFRCWDSHGGMCGWKPTITDALIAAMKFGTVYEFENYKEAFEFLNKK